MRVLKAIRYVGSVASAVGLTVAGLVAIAQAQTPPPLKIGVTEGFSGVYADLTPARSRPRQMAIEDFGGKVLGRPIELLSADHQTKPDIGVRSRANGTTSTASKMITGIGTSSVALAVRKVARKRA